MFYIPSVFDQVKKWFKPRDLTIDGLLFWLHYRVSLVLCVIAMAIISLKAHFGDPIDCVWDGNNAISGKVMNSYCWLHGTYTYKYINKEDELDCLSAYESEEACITGAYNREVSQIIENIFRKERLDHTYYQWLGWILGIQALLFTLPHQLWKKWEKKRIQLIISKCNKTPVFNKEEQDKRFDSVTAVYMKFHGRNGGYTLRYIICEILNLFVGVLNFIITDTMFHGRFASYGTDIISEYIGNYHGINTMDTVFPKVSTCRVYKFNLDGKHKVYFGLWCWFVFIITWSAINIVYWMVIHCSSRFRDYLMTRKISESIDGVHYKAFVSKVATFTPNVDELTFVRLMQQIAEQKSGLLDTPYGIKMEQIESVYNKFTHKAKSHDLLAGNPYAKKFESGEYNKNDEYSCDDSGLGEDDGKSGSYKQTRKNEAPGGGLGILISGKRKQETVPTYTRQQEEASIFPDEVICQDHCQTLQITRNQESHQNSGNVKPLTPSRPAPLPCKPQLCKQDAINQESADSTPPQTPGSDHLGSARSSALHSSCFKILCNKGTVCKCICGRAETPGSLGGHVVVDTVPGTICSASFHVQKPEDFHETCHLQTPVGYPLCENLRYATAGTPDACVDDNRAGYGDTENVMCDFIKMKDERRSWKGNFFKKR